MLHDQVTVCLADQLREVVQNEFGVDQVLECLNLENS